jgi:hypothetical protein
VPLKQWKGDHSRSLPLHLKPTHRKSWAFHASNGWYIRPSKTLPMHPAIMEGTEDNRLADTFRFKHHTMPVLMI